MKNRYIALMAKCLTAYSDEQIQNYFDRVKEEGLTEHGFPRLTSNLGILIAHGIRTDLLPLFIEMMDLCCHSIPFVKAANEFSVREIVCCIMECEQLRSVPTEKITEWKTALALIEPEKCYNQFARTPEQNNIRNWALFTALSEHMRGYIGLPVSEEFIEIQLASQIKYIDENGMYMDHQGSDAHNPMVYDIGPRALLSKLLHFGYRGRYYEKIDACLRQAGLLSLRMQSVTGELPFGGRSNQFLFNEAIQIELFEYEATRYEREGNLALASAFRAGIEKALGCIEMWLARTPIRHNKNRFPTESKYGCEKYAYFDKYMITVASYLHSAYLLHTPPSVELPAPQEIKTDAFALSKHFHKIFLRGGSYFLEFDTNADLKYDARGLGRVHKAGAPSAICLSVACPRKPNYRIDRDDAVTLSLCPALPLKDGSWLFALGKKTQYSIVSLSEDGVSAQLVLSCTFENGESVEARYEVSDSGVEITVSGNGKVGHMLPAFAFDGERNTEISANEHSLTVAYDGYVCRYTTNGTIRDTGNIACNRNGHYRAFTADSLGSLTIRIEIEKA